MKRIEEEIKSKFQNEHHKAVVNIHFTAYKLENDFKSILVQFNLSPQQFNLLRILRGQYPNPVTVGLLKDRMMDKSSDVSRLVDRLVSKSLVESCPNKTDKRQRNLTISNLGLEMLQTIDIKLPDYAKTFSLLSTKEAQQLNHLLDKLRGSI